MLVPVGLLEEAKSWIFLLLVAAVVVWTMVTPARTQGAEDIRYEVVAIWDPRGQGEGTQKVLERYAKRGWELAEACIWRQAPDSSAFEGYLIFRQSVPAERE